MKQVVVALLVSAAAGCQWAASGPVWPCGELTYTFEPGTGTTVQRQDAHDLMWEIGLLTGRHIRHAGDTANPHASGRGAIEIGWRTITPGRPGWADVDSADGVIVGADIVIDPAVSRHRAVLAHELGHVVGLAHVTDPSEIMHPAAPVDVWGPGDRAGITHLSTLCA